MKEKVLRKQQYQPRRKSPQNLWLWKRNYLSSQRKECISSEKNRNTSINKSICVKINDQSEKGMIIAQQRGKNNFWCREGRSRRKKTTT